MSIDIGPFQEIVGIHFPTPDTPEDFQNGEGIKGRAEGCQEESEYAMGGGISITDPDNRSCACPASEFSGTSHGYTLRVTFPLTETWPSCVIGASSGAKLSKLWPDEPDGWGGGAPAAFNNGDTCDISAFISGAVLGGSYRVTYFIVASCTPPLLDENCCG